MGYDSAVLHSGGKFRESENISFGGCPVPSSNSEPSSQMMTSFNPIADTPSPQAYTQSPQAYTQKPIVDTRSPQADTQKPILDTRSPIISNQIVEIPEDEKPLFTLN